MWSHIYGNIMSILISRNTPIPVRKEQVRHTIYDYQSSCLFKVYQGERSRLRDNILLGEFRLANIPLAPRGVTKAKICFDIDANGILKVSAKEPITGHKNSFTITNDKMGLGEEEIVKMLEDAKKYKVEDQEYKKKVDAYIALEDYVYVIKTKMKDDNIKKRVGHEDLEEMDDVIKEAMQWLDINKLAEKNVLADRKKKLEYMFNLIVG